MLCYNDFANILRGMRINRLTKNQLLTEASNIPRTEIIDKMMDKFPGLTETQIYRGSLFSTCRKELLPIAKTRKPDSNPQPKKHSQVSWCVNGRFVDKIIRQIRIKQ